MVAKRAYLYCIGTCLVVAVIYNILIRLFAPILVWLSILATGVALGGTTYFLRKYHEDKYYEGSEYSENMGNILQIVIYILYGACVLFVLTVLCMYRNIQISIGVL